MTINIQRVNYVTILRKNEVTSANYERVKIGQGEIEFSLFKQREKARKEKKTASEMKTFQRYLSSINRGSIVEVLDLPAAVLDHLLAKFFRYTFSFLRTPKN